MKNVVLIIMVICLSVFWYGFQSKRINATTVSDTGSNLSGANLTGANLTGVSLDGVILCNTTMPDGTINNSSCKN